MPYGNNLFATAEEKDQVGLIYGSEKREARFLEGNNQYRRFAPLARKALSHYAPETYDPETVDYTAEWKVRHHISNIISAKVQSGIDYDWQAIDSFLGKTIDDMMGGEPKILEKDRPYRNRQQEEPQRGFAENKEDTEKTARFKSFEETHFNARQQEVFHSVHEKMRQVEERRKKTRVENLDPKIHTPEFTEDRMAKAYFSKLGINLIKDDITGKVVDIEHTRDRSSDHSPHKSRGFTKDF